MDGAAECADAAEMELGPGGDASGRDPLAPPCPDLRTLAESVMDLLWVTLTLTSGRIQGSRLGGSSRPGAGTRGTADVL